FRRVLFRSRVAGDRGAAAPGGGGDAQAVAHGQCPVGLLLAAREQYRGGRHAVVGGVVSVLGEAAGVVLRLEAGVDEGLDEGRARRRVDRSRRPGHDASSHTRWTARVKRSTPWSISSGVTT